MKPASLLASTAALLGAISAPAFAASTFHLVVPLAVRTQVQEPVEAITVSLAGAALPKATVNQAYNESLSGYLTVTGDPALDKSVARWSLKEGTLPAGLSLDATTGTVAGTPTTKTTSPASFTVLATYKGSNGQAIYTVEVGGVRFEAKQVSPGFWNTCAITGDNLVKCWGSNSFGVSGAAQTSLVPTEVRGLEGVAVIDVSVGLYHGCAVLVSSQVKCWGYNDSGALGTGTIDKTTKTAVLANISGAKKVYAGQYRSCAILNDDTVKCWGRNTYGQLGLGTSTDTGTPTAISGLTGVTQLGLGLEHSCALSSGSVKCWGRNMYGEIGTGTTVQRSVPTPVTLPAGTYTSLAVGSGFACAAKSGGDVYCWGGNGNGQLGDGSTKSSTTPVKVLGLTAEVIRLTAGGHHVCAETVEHKFYCWGYNAYGQLGDNSTIQRVLPTEITVQPEPILSLIAGYRFMCGFGISGTLYCWGQNGDGQLGNGIKQDSLTPVEVQPM